VGAELGTTVGREDGMIEGLLVGWFEGENVGMDEGNIVGDVGFTEAGMLDGILDGELVINEQHIILPWWGPGATGVPKETSQPTVGAVGAGFCLVGGQAKGCWGVVKYVGLWIQKPAGQVVSNVGFVDPQHISEVGRGQLFKPLGAMIPLAGGQTVGTVPGWQNPKLFGVGPAGLTSGLKPQATAVKRTFPGLSRFVPGSISVSIISVVLDSCEIMVGLLIEAGTGVLNKLWDVTSAGRLTGLIKFLTICIIVIIFGNPWHTWLNKLRTITKIITRNMIFEIKKTIVERWS